MSENVIDNSVIKSFNFKSIDEVYTYKKLTLTQQSNFFTTFISYNFRLTNISPTNSKLYYYNDTLKLWSVSHIQQFESFVYSFFDNTSTEIKMLVQQSKEGIDKYILKHIEKLCDEFDKDAYVKKMISRSITSLYNIQFLELLDNNPDFLPINNGKKVNLKTLEITDRTYHDYFTYFSPVDYITDEKLPHADKFFKMFQSKKANREYVRKVLGYCITGDTKARKFFIWYGYGSNGKTQIFKLLNMILCKQYTSCAKEIFMKGKSNTDGSASPHIMALLGKRCGVYSEGETSDNIEMNIGQIKQISGEDKITGRPLYYKDGLVEFYPYSKLNLLTNYTTGLDGQKATVDRTNYIFCDNIFIDQPKDKNYILKENEYIKDSDFTNKLETIYLSEIFSWIVRGSQKYYEDKRVEMTEEFKARSEDILNNYDSIKTFIETKIERTKNKTDIIKKKDLMDCYFSFCEENSQRKQPKSSLIARLEQVGIFISPSKAQNIAIYTNLRIINNEETDDENDSQDLPESSVKFYDSPGVYDSDVLYPKNSVVITSEQYEEYLRLKAQIEKVDEEVEEEDEEVEEEDEEVEVKKPKLPAMKVKVNNNITMNVLEDIVVKEVKKQEVKQEVNNIMDEDNDDEIPINTNRKDKRPLRKPNANVTHHDISIIKGLDLGF
jgi:phage/plasmid-associated DNA primase